jgi:transposase
VPHTNPDDPLRRRGNKARGHGNWDNDRPPVCGVVGRESGHVRLTVTERSDGETLERVVMRASWPMVTVNTDEWGGYNGLPGMGRTRPTVCHADHEWARDDDGDGVREVHVNTLEGLWTGMRNFLRLFRGVSKKYLYQYVALFEWGLQRQEGDAAIPVGDPRCEVSHHLTYMSRKRTSEPFCRVVTESTRCCLTAT